MYSLDTESTSSRDIWVRAFSQTAPIAFGYIPVGLAYGVLAGKMGLSTANTILMSLLVYAGSSQLIAVSLFAAAAAPASIILTTFVVNLRHLLMSAALSPHMGSWRKSALALFSYELTDETFAVHATRFAQGRMNVAETFRINMIAQTSWVLGTILGVLASGLITDVRPVGLDYALPAMFIALLVAQLKQPSHVVAALAGGGSALVMKLAGMSQWETILATLAGATLGMLAQSRWNSVKQEGR